MDETPFYWEYLPRKIVCSKLSRKCTSWRRNYHNQRSTVALSVTATGRILRPTLILKRTTPYNLRVNNRINLLTLHSKKGWMDETNMITWIDKVLVPYVKSSQALLLVDSYEGHQSSKVLEHLKKLPNIHVGIIIGGTTSYCQPLDIRANKEFKAVCRKKSLECTNNMIRVLDEINVESENKVSDKIMLLGNQMVIVEKDLERSRKQRRLDQTLLFKKMTVEDVYPWIESAYDHLSENERLIRSGFIRAGFVDDDDEMFEGSNTSALMHDQYQDLENELIPMEDKQEDDQEAKVNIQSNEDEGEDGDGDEVQEEDEAEDQFEDENEDEYDCDPFGEDAESDEEELAMDYELDDGNELRQRSHTINYDDDFSYQSSRMDEEF